MRIFLNTIYSAILIAGLAPSSVLVGSLLGTKFKLTNENLLTWLLQHTHPWLIRSRDGAARGTRRVH